MREFEIFYCLNFKLTLREYKARFDNATKRADETFFYFAARLRNNLRYYLGSRDCLDDFERVFSLLISDKLKSCLPAGALNYVLSLEGNDWFDPRRIGELADTYVSNHTSMEKPKHVSVHMWPVMGQSHPKRMPKMVDDLGTLFGQQKAKIPTRKCCVIIARKRAM